MITCTHFAERFQTPAGAFPNKTQDCREVVGEYDFSEPGAITEACNLEYFCGARFLDNRFQESKGFTNLLLVSTAGENVGAVWTDLAIFPVH